MKSIKVNIGDNGLATQYNNLRDDAFASAHLLPHEQTTPDLTLKVESGVCFIGTTKVVFAGGNSPSFTAPTTNPRIDLLTIDSAGVLARVVGTEAASPSIPAYPADKVVLCEVFNRVGQTTIRDTDTAGQGYIQRDTRPFLGGTFVSSDAQVDAAAAIQISKIRKNSHVTPEIDNTYDLGSSALQWREVRAVKVFKNNVEVGGKFGGTGADGALSISSGTTTLSFASAKILVKNYTSISITGTAVLAFSTPHDEGSTAIIRSQGNVTITSTTVPAVDTRSMGGLGGAAGSGGNFKTTTRGGIGKGVGGGRGGFTQGLTATGSTDSVGGAGGGGGGSITIGSDGGAGAKVADENGVSMGGWGGNTVPALSPSKSFAFPGGGGGGGAGGQDENGQQAAGGAGGRGGGGLVIECGGALDISSTFNSSAADGSAGSGSAGAAGGGGGGGAAGQTLILYATLTANTATFTKTGGAAGGGGSGTRANGGAGAAGAAGDSLVAANTFIA